MKVFVMRGVPGSGKTDYTKKHFPNAWICSADTFFMKEGVYRFDAANLKAAHAECLREFTRAVAGEAFGIKTAIGTVVVDNTNITVAEMAPYCALAQAYGHELMLVTIMCDPGKAAARGLHGLTAAKTWDMNDRMLRENYYIPSWWPQLVERGD
jgi:predicted kinase